MELKVVKPEFMFHKLNQDGIKKAACIAVAFSELLNQLEEIYGTQGREISIVKTKLEEACFFAKKAMAIKPENQES